VIEPDRTQAAATGRHLDVLMPPSMASAGRYEVEGCLPTARQWLSPVCKLSGGVSIWFDAEATRV